MEKGTLKSFLSIRKTMTMESKIIFLKILELIKNPRKEKMLPDLSELGVFPINVLKNRSDFY